MGYRYLFVDRGWYTLDHNSKARHSLMGGKKSHQAASRNGSGKDSRQLVTIDATMIQRQQQSTAAAEAVAAAAAASSSSTFYCYPRGSGASDAAEESAICASLLQELSANSCLVLASERDASLGALYAVSAYQKRRHADAVVV